MEENQSYSTVAGNSGVWPNLNHLIATGALPTNYYANSHPSIGNYFMLTTGQLLTTDDNSTAVFNVDNIARRMLSSSVSFRIYAEGITRGYVGGNTGLYLIRHDPFAMLSDVAGNQQVANETIWPFSQFATDLADNALPDFSYIVPNVNDDAHNGTPQRPTPGSKPISSPPSPPIPPSRAAATASSSSTTTKQKTAIPPAEAVMSRRFSGDPSSRPATPKPQRLFTSIKVCCAR